MANLVAIAYDDVGQAQEVMGTIGELVKEHALELDDAVVVERKSNGKVKLHQPSLAGLGAASGALLGRADRAHLLHAVPGHGDRRRERCRSGGRERVRHR